MLFYLSLIDSEEDKESFANLYEATHLMLLKIAMNMLQNADDAENAVHDVYVKLAENYEKYSRKDPEQLRGLLITMVKQKSIDIYRRNKKIDVEEPDNEKLMKVSVNYNPEKVTENLEEQKIILRVLNQMPESLRVVLDLKYYQELKNKEICDLLDIKEKALELRLYRAKKYMRELLENEDIF